MTRTLQEARSSSWSLYLVFAILPMYWMVNMSFKTNEEILSHLLALAAALHAGTTTRPSSPTRRWYSGYINSMIYVAINTVISLAGRPARRLRVLALPASSATSTCSSGCSPTA